MVTITVFFEGGVHPNSNPNEETIDNTSNLRESFNKLFNSGLENENVRIVAKPAYSITNIVRIRKPDSILLMDLDAPKEQKQKRLTDNNLIEIQEFVFFMVQRMEAWILSQPEVIEDVFKHLKVGNSQIKDDNQIKDKHPENLVYPESILNTILQRNFINKKAGIKKNLKYGKLKHSPDLIAKLDIEKLKVTFEDVRLLMEKINQYV